MSWLSSQACMNAGNGHTTRGLRRRGCIHVSRGCSDDMSSESDTEWGAKETIFWLLLCCLCLRPWFRKNEKKKYKSSYHWIPFIHDSQMSAANSLLESNKARRTKMITSYYSKKFNDSLLLIFKLWYSAIVRLSIRIITYLIMQTPLGPQRYVN